MEVSEIKKLIPFYVAGTLDEEERILVENALKESKELQQEVEFWLKAQSTVELHSKFYTEGHLTPEQIIIVAEGGIDSFSSSQPNVIKHLQECESCKRDVEMIKSTYLVEETVSTSKKAEEYLHPRYSKEFKFANVFAIAAILIIIIAVLFTYPFKRDIQLGNQEHYVNLVIPFSQSKRGNNFEEIPILKIDSSTTHVNITVYIPHSEIDSLRYSVSISFPSGVEKTISGYFLPIKVDSVFDMVRFTVESEIFKTIPEKYSLVLKENLPPSMNFLTPESYSYNFFVYR